MEAVDVIVPDGVDDVAREDEASPRRCVVASGEDELCVGELGVDRIDFLGMKLRELCECSGVASTDRLEEILGLDLQLMKIRMHRKVPVRHNEPPWEMPGVRSCRARRRFV
jgi:hypothetical protein